MSNKRRDDLAREVRENLIPSLAQLGFESTRVSASGRSDDLLRGHFFKRRHDGYEDEIWIHWDKYGRSRFILEFKTDQRERMASKGRKAVTKLEYGRIYPSRGPLWRKLLGGEPGWYGSSGRARDVIAVAQKRLCDLDKYLRCGATTPHIWIG